MSLGPRLIIATACSALLLTACSGDPVSSPTSRPSPSLPSVHVNGVTMTLPTGWSQARPWICDGPAAHTVTLYPQPQPHPSCPMTATRELGPAGPSVDLAAVFGPWGTIGWSGTLTSWHGQPAWIRQVSLNGSTRATGVTNADDVTTKDLLAQMIVVSQPSLGVPDAATAMTVTDAHLRQAPTVVTSPDGIRLILDALRSLPAVPSAQACSIPGGLGLNPGARVITFTTTAGKVSLLLVRAPCSQVISGTGAAGAVGQALATALAHAVGSSVQ